MKRQYLFLCGVVCDGNSAEMHPEDVTKRLQELQAAVELAHAIFLDEIDNGHTPRLLTAANGGPGLGYFEDII